MGVASEDIQGESGNVQDAIRISNSNDCDELGHIGYYSEGEHTKTPDDLKEHERSDKVTSGYIQLQTRARS